MKTTAPEKRSVKTLKGQLFGAVSMMLVAAIALGTSTYAWFINNSTVAVDPMQLTVSASTSMTVAVGKQASFATPGTETNWTGYKALITNSDITGLAADGTTPATGDVADWAKMFVNKMTPASITDTTLSAASFFMSNGHLSNSKLDEFVALSKGITDTDAGQGPVKVIPLRFLAAQDMGVYFGRAANATTSIAALTDIANLITKAAESGSLTEADMIAQADAIKKALRVAIVPKDSGTDYTGMKGVVFQFDDGTTHVPGAGNNTLYAGVDGAPTTTIDETKGLYAGIEAVDSNKLVSKDSVLTAMISGTTGSAADYIATVTAATGNEADSVTAGTKPLFTLKASKPLDVDVYIWLEGTDMDCVSVLSSYAFNLDLPFAAAVPTPAVP